MINKKNLVLLFLCFCVKCVLAQHNFQYNHQCFQCYKNNKKIIEHNIRAICNQTYSGRNSNIMYYSDKYEDTDILLPDSLCGLFIITRVVEKKDNYILKKKTIQTSYIHGGCDLYLTRNIP